MSRAGPKSGASSPASRRALQPGGAAAAVEGRPALGRRVEEDRQPELVADRRPTTRGRRLRARQVVRAERHDRDDVGGADPRVRAVVSPQVDSLDRDADARDERVDELVLRPDEREDRAVVVGVGVDVEQTRVRAERVADRIDRRPRRGPR